MENPGIPKPSINKYGIDIEADWKYNPIHR